MTSGRLPPPISLPSSVLCVELAPPSAATSDSFLPHLLCVCVSLPSTYGLVVTTPAIETPPLCVWGPRPVARWRSYAHTTSLPTPDRQKKKEGREREPKEPALPASCSTDAARVTRQHFSLPSFLRSVCLDFFFSFFFLFFSSTIPVLCLCVRLRSPCFLFYWFVSFSGIFNIYSLKIRSHMERPTSDVFLILSACNFLLALNLQSDVVQRLLNLNLWDSLLSRFV